MKTKAIFFIMLLNSFNSFSQWVETGNSLLPGDFFGTINNYAIFTKTNGNNRMKLNHNVLYSVNAGTSVNRTGNLLIGRENNSMIHPYNLYHSSLGAFSLLHLNGDGSQVQEYGYRNWMQTGITFTGNRDLSYFGLRKLSTDDEDFTETTLTWSDNVPGDDGADDFAIRFTSGDDNGTASTVSTNFNLSDDLDGLHLARFTPTGQIGFGNTFGLNATGMSVGYVRPQNLLHMSLDGDKPVFLQITNQNGTGQTATDGLHIGYGTTQTVDMPAIINQRENDRLILKSNSHDRIIVSHTGALAGGYNSNPGSLATNYTRVGIQRDHVSYTMITPLSMLHIGTDIAGPTTSGWRSWMEIGTLNSTHYDQMYVGLKEEPGSILSGVNMDAIINWGPTNAVGPFNSVPDNLRFIFTSYPGAAGAAGTANGLEVARMEPDEALTMPGNPGMMGIGDFSPGSPNATTPGFELNAKLDIDGDLRIRSVHNNDLLERVLVIDPNDQNRVLFRDVSTIGGVVGAFNGTSINPGNNQVQLGQWLGVAPSYPAELVKDTEIPLNNKNLFYSDNNGYPIAGAGTVSIGGGTNATDINAKLIVLEEAQTNVIYPTNAVYGINRDRETIDGFEIVGVRGRSDRPDNMLNVGGAFKGTGAQGASIGLISLADSSSSRDVAGVFTAINDATLNATCVGIVSTAFGSKTQNTAGAFNAQTFGDPNSVTFGVMSIAQGGNISNTGGRFICTGVNNSIDIGIFAQANSIGSLAIQPNDFAAVLQGNVQVDGIVTQAGNLGWSDINLKENFDSISNALDSIKLLKPTQYTFKQQNAGNIHFDSRRHFGFISQELETVYPNLVATTYTAPELDTTGNVIHDGLPFKALDYNSLIALTVKAIQELDRKVTQQDSLITALNNQLQACCRFNNERSSTDQTQLEETTTFKMTVHLNNSNVVYLGQNAPNPFIEHTVINFVVPAEAKVVEMQFFDSNGKEIQSINISQRGKGLLNVYGENLSSGLYTYVLIIDGKVISSKRMIKTN